MALVFIRLPILNRMFSRYLMHNITFKVNKISLNITVHKGTVGEYRRGSNKPRWLIFRKIDKDYDHTKLEQKCANFFRVH